MQLEYLSTNWLAVALVMLSVVGICFGASACDGHCFAAVEDTLKL